MTARHKDSILTYRMPNTKAAHKALRQNEKRRVINLRKSRDLKTLIKGYKKSVDSGSGEEARTKLPAIYKALDKAAKTNIIKANKASRLKSRLTKKLAGQKQTVRETAALNEGVEPEA